MIKIISTFFFVVLISIPAVAILTAMATMSFEYILPTDWAFEGRSIVIMADMFITAFYLAFHAENNHD